MSSYVKSINAFSTGLLSNSPEGPPHELDSEPIWSGAGISILTAIELIFLRLIGYLDFD